MDACERVDMSLLKPAGSSLRRTGAYRSYKALLLPALIRLLTPF